MIIERQPRWCDVCRATQVHDVEYRATPARKAREVRAVCLHCGRATEPQRISRAEQQNGGGGDQRYRARRRARV